MGVQKVASEDLMLVRWEVVAVRVQRAAGEGPMVCRWQVVGRRRRSGEAVRVQRAAGRGPMVCRWEVVGRWPSGEGTECGRWTRKCGTSIVQ